MKGIRVSQTGGPDVLDYVDMSEPQITSEMMLVEQEAIGVNFIDTYHRNGLYPLDLPFTPGIEGAGKVLKVGSGVTEFRPGGRVVYCLTKACYAERVSVEASKTAHLPEAISPSVAVAAMCQGMTAHYLCTDCYSIQKGDGVLVHAAAGGVGHLLTQMAKNLGATVFGTVSTEKKAELARASGVDHVIRYSEEDFKEKILEMTGREGLNVVYESVGKVTFSRSLDCLKPRGYMVLFGQSSGPVPPLDPQILNQKGSLFLTRPTLFHYAANRSEFLRRANAVLKMVQAGKIEIRVGEQLPLSKSAEAHRLLEGRKTIGKVILIPEGALN